MNSSSTPDIFRILTGWYTLLLLLVIVILSSCRRDEEIFSKDKQVKIINQSYGSDSLQTMDIYLPSNRNDKTPAVICIHGGGWNRGGKNWFEDIAPLFVDEGIAVASIDYRYADSIEGIEYLDLLSDINKAINFLQCKSNTYGCLFNNLTLFGHSAGAHLALLFAYKYQNSSIRNVVSISGITDLRDTSLLSNAWMASAISNLIGGGLDSLKLQDASPIKYCSSVRTILYHGLNDDDVPCSQSIKLFNKISLFNLLDRLILIENATHYFNSDQLRMVVNDVIQMIKSETDN
ncbi:MAG: alpha/beta hydrolase [Bacteroidota bacterium]